MTIWSSDIICVCCCGCIPIRIPVYFGKFYNYVWWHPRSWIELSLSFPTVDRSSSSTCSSRKTWSTSPSSFTTHPKRPSPLITWNPPLSSLCTRATWSSPTAHGTLEEYAWYSKVEVDAIAKVFWLQRRIYCYRRGLPVCSVRLNDYFWWEGQNYRN